MLLLVVISEQEVSQNSQKLIFQYQYKDGKKHDLWEVIAAKRNHFSRFVKD